MSLTREQEPFILSEYLFTCILPEQYRVKLDNLVLPELASKVHYLSQKGMRLTEWNDKVYDFIRKLQRTQ
jgi:hypothetical protein